MYGAIFPTATAIVEFDATLFTSMLETRVVHVMPLGDVARLCVASFVAPALNQPRRSNRYQIYC